MPAGLRFVTQDTAINHTIWHKCPCLNTNPCICTCKLASKQISTLINSMVFKTRVKPVGLPEVGLGECKLCSVAVSKAGDRHLITIDYR